MRASLRMTALAAVLAALPSAAHAQAAFDKQISHWRVIGGGPSCMAMNRPAYELNASPYNALMIVLNKQGRWRFMVLFWPKAFTRDADVPLVFTFGGVKDVKALGKATEDYAVTLADIGASFRDDVAKAQQMIVAAEGLTTQLHFDNTNIAPVFAALEECAKTLK